MRLSVLALATAMFVTAHASAESAISKYGAAQLGSVAHVTAESFRGDYPLTEDGIVQCRKVGGLEVVWFNSDESGENYQLNGAAKRYYRDVRPIWRDHPQFDGLKVNIGPLIEIGLELCAGP